MLLDFIPRVPPRAFKDEAEFQTWIGGCLRDHFGFGLPYHKMSDASSDKKPCDCFFVHDDNRSYFMELKVIDGYTINLKKFEYQQVEFLSRLSITQKANFPFERIVRDAHTFALALVYSKKLQRWELFHWHLIEEELMKNGSIQLFAKV